MKETPRKRITVTSSINEISTEQVGNRMVLVFLQQASGEQIITKDVNG
jgi:hypothetical protein